MRQNILTGLKRLFKRLREAFSPEPVLPPIAACYWDARPALVIRGSVGFHTLETFNVEGFNRSRGVTPPQESAMAGGALYGWDSPKANPANYDSHGRYLKGESNE